jgi:hypothetical protein
LKRILATVSETPAGRIENDTAAVLKEISPGDRTTLLRCLDNCTNLSSLDGLPAFPFPL